MSPYLTQHRDSDLKFKIFKLYRNFALMMSPSLLYLVVLFDALSLTVSTVGLPSYAQGGLLSKLENDHNHQLKNHGCIEHNLTVPLNWFGGVSGSAKMMNIRYWVDNSCANGNLDAVPILLQMGGEAAARCWPCNEAIPDQSRKVTTVSVEHRFYGMSVPDEGLNSKNLKFLTTTQNLADTAAIIKAVNPNNKRRVLNFGGSYSGATAAWFRIKYPNLTYAAISSSGVVNAIIDFVQFDQSVVSTLQKYKAKCLYTVVKAMNALDEMSETELNATKTNPFNASTEQTLVDFTYMVADALALAVQYGGKKHLCQVLSDEMEDHGNPVAAVAATIPVLYGPSFQQNCFYDTSCIAKTVRDSSTGVGNKAWRWQKCSMLGYIQSRPNGTKFAARSRRLTLESQRKQCLDMFPGNEEELDRLIMANDAFQATYGGARPETAGASRILFLDFSDDPWQRASVEAPIPSTWASKDLHYCYLNCDGCGHCGSGVPDKETKCKLVQQQLIGKWLDE